MTTPGRERSPQNCTFCTSFAALAFAEVLRSETTTARNGTQLYWRAPDAPSRSSDERSASGASGGRW